LIHARWLLWGLLLTTCSLLASAQEQTAPEVQAFLASWARKMRGARTLHVRFEQSKKLRVLRKARKSTGEAWLKGKRLHMVVRDLQGVVEVELLVDGNEAKILYPGLKRLEIYPLDKQRAAPTPFPIFGGDVEALPKTYRIRLTRSKTADLLLLTPRDAKASLREMRIWFKPGTQQVSALEQVTRRGDRVRMDIRAFEINADLSQHELALRVPPGTKVSRLTGK